MHMDPPAHSKWWPGTLRDVHNMVMHRRKNTLPAMAQCRRTMIQRYLGGATQGDMKLVLF